MPGEFTYFRRLIVTIGVAVLIGIWGEGCGSGKDMEQFSLRLAGSTSMEKLSNAWAEDFMKKYPNVRVTTEFTGSSAGIEAVLSGGADIGNSSRSLKESEIEEGAMGHLVAVDGIIVCVDPSNNIGSLTCSQLISIYTGNIVNWTELGGPDLPVVVMGREAGSGTRGVFEECLGITDQCNYVNELDSAGAVMARVASTPGAIGYVSLDIVDDSVNVLSLEGVDPSVENIKEGSYFLRGPLMMVTRGEIFEQEEIVQIWFGYVYSEEGQSVAEQLGYVSIR